MAGTKRGGLWLLGLLVACSAGPTDRATSSSPGAGTAEDVTGSDGGTGGGSVSGGTTGMLPQGGGGSSSGGEPATDGEGGIVPATPGEEVCDNGLDDDLDGLVDEECFCDPGTKQVCYLGPAESAGTICPAGSQQCRGAEFAQWGPCESTGAPFPKDACQCFPEVCDNAKDDNCNGQVDEGCAVEVPVDIDGDCVTAQCPAYAPYPVGCDLVMEGNDSRGCIASTPQGSEVYFQEGNNCPVLGGVLGSAGNIMGKLVCSSQPGAPLDAANCPLNKDEKFFVASSDDCPN